MFNSNFIKTNKVKILIGILFILLLRSSYLIIQLNNSVNRIGYVRENQYDNFFHALIYCSRDLDYFANNDFQNPDDIERQQRVLYAHGFNLLEHARTYAMLSDKGDELPSLIWDFAVHIKNITQNLNQVESKNNRDNLKAFSRVVNEIVKLENHTRVEMLLSKEGFVEKEMYIILSPKVAKVVNLFNE